MGYYLKSSSTAKPLLFLMVDGTDHVTGKTGLTVTVTISKNGAAFASPAGAVTELSGGWYKVAGNATDTNAVGPLLLHATATGADPCDDCYNVVAFDPDDAVHLGLTCLPNTAVTTNASLLTSGSGTDQLSVTTGRVDVGKTLGTAVTLDANSVLNVSTKYVGGTLQTARDLGTSVLLSSGTGTGQISLSSGAVLLQATQTGVTIPTVTNLTNAPTAGDFTATMKTSLNAATPASVVGAVGSVTGAVGSVTGNVGGNVVGSVASVTARVTANADQWAGGTIPTPTTTGVPLVNLTWAGFYPPRTVAMTTPAALMKVTDLSGDGRPDIAISYPSGKIGILLGNGNGTFAPASTYALSDSDVMAVGDVNGDGKTDVVAVSLSLSTITTLLSNGNGTFQAPVTQGSVALGSTYAAVLADINGDSKADLVLTDPTGIRLMLSNGNGTFRAPTTFGTTGATGRLAAGDLTGDGNPDIVATLNDGTSKVAVFLSNGNGTFAPAVTYATRSFPYGVALADVNGDGKLDILVVNNGSKSLSVLLGNGNGTFAAQTTYAASGFSGFDIATSADINGDGLGPDVLITAKQDNAVIVMKGNGDGTFAFSRTFSVGTYPVAIAVADVTGDGISDCLTLNTTSTNVSVLVNPSGANVTFASGTDFSTAMKTSLNAATPASVTGSVGSISGVTFPANFSSLAIQNTTGYVTSTNAGVVIRSGTAQAGGASTITLDSGASATSNLYANEVIALTGGTGAGQSAIITAYNGATKVATINGTWATAPDVTTTFSILPLGSIPGASAPTAAQVATAVWQDLTAGTDFTVSNSVGTLVTGLAGNIASALLGQTLIVNSPVGRGSLNITKENSYLNADGNALDWTKPTGATWPTDLTGWTITFTATKSSNNSDTSGTVSSITATGSVVTATGSGQKVRIELTKANTTGLYTGAGNKGYEFDIVATSGTTHRVTLIAGQMTVVDNVTA